MKHVPAVFKSATFILLSIAVVAIAIVCSLASFMFSELWLQLSAGVIVASLLIALIGYTFNKA